MLFITTVIKVRLWTGFTIDKGWILKAVIFFGEYSVADQS